MQRCAKPSPTLPGVLLLVALLVPSALFADEWERHAEACRSAMETPAIASAERLRTCLAKWYQARHPEDTSTEERDRVYGAASHLYRTGNRAQAHTARLVLERLGVKLPKREGEETPLAPAVSRDGEEAERAPATGPARETYVAEEVSAAAQAKARAQRKKGFKAYKKKRYGAAIRSFEKAVSLYPGYVQALYDLACTHALAGDASDAVEYLRRLVDLGTEPAMAKVNKARTDPDFRGLHNDPGFRAATGYARVKIVNGVGEFGEDQVEGFAKLLRELDHDVAEVGEDKAKRRFPIIWFRPSDGASATMARFYRRVLGHPKTRYGPIDWDSDFDIIISWGDVIEYDDRGDPIVKEYAPTDARDADRKADELRQEQDRALQQPEGYAHDVDHAVGTPGRMKQKGEESIRRTERTIDTIERTGDKVRDVFK